MLVTQALLSFLVTCITYLIFYLLIMLQIVAQILKRKCMHTRNVPAAVSDPKIITCTVYRKIPVISPGLIQLCKGFWVGL